MNFIKNSKHGLTKPLSYSKLSLVLSGQVKCASGSAVEHLLAKEGVAGSIPVSRSFLFLEQSGNFVFLCYISTERKDIRNVALFLYGVNGQIDVAGGTFAQTSPCPLPVKKLQ